MKLLIVDDEELTRTGVISSIDWASLGISEVLQADDGVHGLEAAQLHRPEIIEMRWNKKQQECQRQICRMQ